MSILTTTTAALDLSAVETLEDHKVLLDQAVKAKDLSPWWIGDIMLSAENKLGEVASQLYDASDESLRKYIRIAARFPVGKRFPKASFSHHMICASFNEETATAFLTSAIEFEWSLRDLKQAIQRDQAIEGTATEPTENTDAEAQPDEPPEEAPIIETPDEIREAIPTRESDLPTAIQAKKLNRPYGDLVSGIDQLARTIGEKGKNHAGAEACLDHLHGFLVELGRGQA